MSENEAAGPLEKIGAEEGTEGLLGPTGTVAQTQSKDSSSANKSMALAMEKYKNKIQSTKPRKDNAISLSIEGEGTQWIEGESGRKTRFVSWSIEGEELFPLGQHSSTMT